MTTDDEIKARGRWSDFKPGSAGSMAHQVADVETGTPEDKAKMWTDAGYEGSAFTDDDFDYDKIEDAKDGDPLRDAYIKAAKTLHEMTGDPTPTNWSNDDWVDFAKSEMSWFSQNSVGLAKWAIRVNSDDATDQQKAAFGYLMELHEHSNTSWGDVGNFLYKGLLADPTTYVGVATFGAGTLAAQGGKQAAKMGIKAAVKAAVKKTVTGSIAYGIKTSLKEGAELTAKRGITKSVGLGIKTGLKNSWKTGGMAVAAESVVQGVGFDYGMQKTKIGVGLQDKYSGWQSVMSGGLGLVFGEVLSPAMAGAGTALGKGAKKAFGHTFGKTAITMPDPKLKSTTGLPVGVAHPSTLVPEGGEIAANGITGKQIKSAWNSIKSAFPKWGSKKSKAGNNQTHVVHNAQGKPVGGFRVKQTKTTTPPAQASTGQSGNKILLDPKQTIAHKIYGGTVKTKSLGEAIPKWTPSTKLGVWFSKRRLKFSNPFYSLPAKQIPFIGPLAGNPSNFLPSRISMGSHIRNVIYRFDDLVQKHGLITNAATGKTKGGSIPEGPIVNLLDQVKDIKLANYNGDKATRRQLALDDAKKLIDDFANDTGNRQKLADFRKDLVPLREQVKIEKTISDIAITLRKDDSSFSSVKNDPTTALSNVFKDIGGLNNTAKNKIITAIESANKELAKHGHPQVKPEDFIKRVEVAGKADRGYTLLDNGQLESMSNWLENADNVAKNLLAIDPKTKSSTYTKDFSDFMENTLQKEYVSNDELYEKQLTQQLQSLKEIGLDPFVRLKNREADKFATDFSLKNLKYFEKRSDKLSAVRKLERQITDNVYIKEKRVAAIKSPDEMPNAENFGIRIEQANPETDQDLVVKLVNNAYETGYEEEAIYALRYLKYRAGANSDDRIFSKIAQGVDSNPPPDIQNATRGTNDPHWRAFVDKIRAIDSDTKHSPQPRHQRATLRAFAMATYWPRMARRFPGTRELSTPFRQKYFIEPFRKSMIDIPGYFLGGQAYPKAKKADGTTMFSFTTGKSLFSGSEAKLPKGFEVPEGKTFTNENKWFRRAFWWEKKGTTNIMGDKKGFGARAPLWAKIPARTVMFPMHLGWKTSKAVWKGVTNPFVKPIFVTTAGIGLGWHLVTEGNELLFNNGEDYDHNMPWNDAGRKYALDPVVYTLDKGLVTPLKLGAEYTYKWGDYLTGDALPDWNKLKIENEHAADYINLYDAYKGVTSAEVGGYSLLDWPGATQSASANPEDITASLKKSAEEVRYLQKTQGYKDYVDALARLKENPDDEALKTIVDNYYDENLKVHAETVKNAQTALKDASDKVSELEKDAKKQQDTLADPKTQESIDTAQATYNKAKAAYDAETNASIKKQKYLDPMNEAKEALDKANKVKTDAETRLDEILGEADANGKRSGNGELKNAEDNLSSLQSSIEASSADIVVILNALPPATAQELLKQSPDISHVVKDKVELNSELKAFAEGSSKKKIDEEKDKQKKKENEEENEEENGKDNENEEDAEYKSGRSKLPKEGAMQRMADTLFRTGDKDIDNFVDDSTTLLGAAWAGLKDTASGTFSSLNSSSGGRTAMAVGGGLLSSWLGMNLIGKWFDGTMLGKIPFLGGAIKLVLGIGIFLAGMKGTTKLMQGSGKHTPNNFDDTTLEQDASSETTEGGEDSKSVEKKTGAIETKKLLNENKTDVIDPTNMVDEGAYANLKDDENNNVVAMKTQSHEGGEEKLLIKSGKSAEVVELYSKHDGTIAAVSGTGKFIDLNAVDPSVEKISGSKANLLRGMIKDDTNAITMDIESLANVTRDQMSEQEIKLVQLNSGLPGTTPDPSNTLGRTV